MAGHLNRLAAQYRPSMLQSAASDKHGLNPAKMHAACHHTSKMSMAGWWMVHAIVRPVSTMLRTTRITIAAARASRPANAINDGGSLLALNAPQR